MRLRIRGTLLYAIVALMACSLSAVSAVVLLRHLAVVKTVADREIEQAANDVAHRVSRFLENGPAALNRVKYFIEHQGIALTDTERMTDYLVSEAQASPALTWVSVSSAETGAFLGVGRGATARSSSTGRTRGSIAGSPVSGAVRRWDVGIPEDRTGCTLRSTRQGMVRAGHRHEQAELDGPLSVRRRLGRHLGGDRPEASGNRPGDGCCDRRLPPARDRNFPGRAACRAWGRALIIAPKSTSGPVVLGAGADLPAELRAVITAMTERVATDPSSSQHPEGRSDGLFRTPSAGSSLTAAPLPSAAVCSGNSWSCCRSRTSRRRCGPPQRRSW